MFVVCDSDDEAKAQGKKTLREQGYHAMGRICVTLFSSIKVFFEIIDDLFVIKPEIVSIESNTR